MAETRPPHWDPYWRNEVAPKVLAELHPLHEPGTVNTERAEHYIQAVGLPLASYVIVEKDAIGDVGEVLKKNKIDSGRLDDLHGKYLDKINLGIVINDDPTQAEETLVHELGHVEQPQALVKPETFRGLAVYVRDYIRLITRGHFTSEGFSAMLQGSYRELLLARHRYEEVGAEYEVAGLTMEALCTFDPELFDDIVASRNDISVLPQVNNRLDTIDPGLAVRLDKLPHPRFRRAPRLWTQSAVDIWRATGISSNVYKESTVLAHIASLLFDYENRTGYTFTVDPKKPSP